jgi:large subunit ribosomal protein L3
MSKQLMGIKIGMTQIWKNDKFIPVTVIQIPKAEILEEKTIEKHGYHALKVGAINVDSKKLTKPQAGQFKKIENSYKKIYEITDMKASDTNIFDVTFFSEGEKIKITGRSKGHGFSGSMRRHNFAGGNDSHGSMSHRRGGSIGCRLTPGRVFKGRKMPGHLGDNIKTELGKEIVQIIPDKDLILLKGGVPGGKNGFIYLKKWEQF